MSVSEKVKCIDGNDKKLSISRQCELLQLPRSSYEAHRRRVAEIPVLWQPKDEGLSEPQRFSCKPQTNPEIDAVNGLGVSSSQAKHQQAEKGA